MDAKHEFLRQLLVEAIHRQPPSFTRRDITLPTIKGKVFSAIGIRRSGKTTYLWQCLSDRLAAGAPAESLILLGLEDDRLSGLEAADLSWLIEEYYQLNPSFRDDHTVTFLFDEIQTVSGWEGFVRRLMDTEQVEVLLSGSSAKLLSREVATAMRGRGLEILVHPFSFREALRHAGAEPDRNWKMLPKAARSDLQHRLRRYLVEGGFPEAQDLDIQNRMALLRSYVDVVVLRDVIERHAVSNPLPLRWLQRQLLANPAGLFSVNKHYETLRSQGFAVGKDTVHAFLAHLEDAFLVRTINLQTASERKRMVNPRKVYPVDPGLIPLYERSGRENLGHALETVVLLELERRGYEAAYVKTKEGGEVDFLATSPGKEPLLIQVSLEVREDETLKRETRSLVASAAEHPGAHPLLITCDSTPPAQLPEGVSWKTAAEWLLEEA